MAKLNNLGTNLWGYFELSFIKMEMCNFLHNKNDLVAIIEDDC